ncbi:exosortase XrtF [Cochleicola gelatinilyticus]|uniref:Exosortase XrtF n=1 Tax=Cochleicola gelatinilyticus TaxID=1763537 RepID=A0A167JEZ7_9FLAO|nr:exosortase XrtF [Cochleicola gelatinilyticus]
MFFGTYLILSLLYAGYLHLSTNSMYYPDPITHLVAKQSTNAIQGFGYNATILPHEFKPQMVLNMNGTYLASIVEGCNAVSIIILFFAFVVAFAEGFKKTFLFLVTGAVLIYAMNIARIIILAIALHAYPQHEKILHGVLFPALIYGMVFLLWVFWIRMLNTNAVEKNE